MARGRLDGARIEAMREDGTWGRYCLWMVRDCILYFLIGIPLSSYWNDACPDGVRLFRLSDRTYPCIFLILGAPFLVFIIQQYRRWRVRTEQYDWYDGDLHWILCLVDVLVICAGLLAGSLLLR